MAKDITNEILAAVSNEVLVDPYLTEHDPALMAFVAGLVVGTLTRVMTDRHARIVTEEE